jgi:hypothetical protein
MPWNKKDVDSHTQSADSPKLKRQWTHVANKVLAETGDEGTAVKEANGVVAKESAKKSMLFGGLMDLAKASRSQGHNSVHFNGPNFNKTRFRKTKFNKTRFNRQHNFGKVRSTRARLKSVQTGEVDKGIGNTIAPYTPHTVRAHKRMELNRMNAHRVKAYKKRRFKDPSQVKNVTNVQDI